MILFMYCVLDIVLGFVMWNWGRSLNIFEFHLFKKKVSRKWNQIQYYKILKSDEVRWWVRGIFAVLLTLLSVWLKRSIIKKKKPLKIGWLITKFRPIQFSLPHTKSLELGSSRYGNRLDTGGKWEEKVTFTLWIGVLMTTGVVVPNGILGLGRKLVNSFVKMLGECSRKYLKTKGSLFLMELEFHKVQWQGWAWGLPAEDAGGKR